MAAPRGDERDTVTTDDGTAGPPGVAARPTRRRVRVLDHAADIAVAAAPVPRSVLDVGTGDGALLRGLALRLPTAEEFAGVDPSSGQVALARRLSDPRWTFRQASADALPWPDESFDLVVAASAFDGWPDRPAALRELGRVLHPAGRVVLVDVRSSAGQVREAAGDAGLDVRRRETVTRLLGLPRSRAYVLGR